MSEYCILSSLLSRIYRLREGLDSGKYQAYLKKMPGALAEGISIREIKKYVEK